LQKYKKL